VNKIRTLQIEFNLESLNTQLQGPAVQMTSKLLAHRLHDMHGDISKAGTSSTRDTLSLFEKRTHAMAEVCVLFFATLLCL
jgi:hypothetical protein